MAMDTSPENSLMNFDLDLLLGPASVSLSVSSDHNSLAQDVGANGSTDLGYQIQSVGTNGNSDHGKQKQNADKKAYSGYYQYAAQSYENNESTRSFETINHKHMLQDMGNLKTTKQNSQDKNKEISENVDYGHLAQKHKLIHSSQVDTELITRKEYDLLWADYATVKKQYAKLASDYAGIFKECKSNAMKYLNVNTKCENKEKTIADITAQMDAINESFQLLKVKYDAQSKQVIQYNNHFEAMAKEIADLKEIHTKNKYDAKERRAQNKLIQTLSDQLCLFACVIVGQKQLDKETWRLMRKYCKFCTNSKKNLQTENIEIQSIDTGRGSSLAFSDGERSYNNSPAYSFTNSPFSIGITTPRNEQTKMMKDSCTSPPPMIKTFDNSTSPIVFEKAIKTSDVATNTVIYHEVPKMKTIDIATSPVKYTDMRISVPKTKTLDAITSPIMFADLVTQEDKTKTFNTAASLIEFTDTAKIKTVEIAVSPVMFTGTTMNIATSPIEFADMMTPVAKTNTSDIAVSPIMFTDTTAQVTKIVTMNIATSPIKIADTMTPVAKTNTSDIAVSPIMFTDTTTRATKIVTMNIATSPIEFADTITSVANTNKSDIAVSPIMFANTVVSSPVNYADGRISAANTRPSETEDTDSPMMCVNEKSPGAETKMLNVISRIKNVDTKAPMPSTMLDVAGPSECTSARVLKSKSLHVENIAIREIIKPIAFVPSSCNTGHTEDYTEKLNEIVSEQSNQSQDDLENDLEIRLILSKYRLDFDMLSPMTATPEADRGHKHIQSESKEEKKQSCQVKSASPTNNKEVCNHSDLTLAQSLYLSEDEQSENEVDNEDFNISDLDVESPEHVEIRHNVSEHTKSTVKNADTGNIKKNNTTPLIDNLVSKSPNNEISNKSRVKPNKTHKSSSKYQKLTKLQKKFKGNIPKNKMKSESINKLRPKPFSIGSNKYSATALSINKEKGCPIAEVNAEKILDKTRDVVEVCQGNIKTSYKEPPKNLKETHLNKLVHPSTNVLDKFGPTETVCKSTETQSKNIIVTPHLPTSLSAKCDAKRRSFVKETESDSINDISNTSIKTPDNYDTNVRKCISSKSSSNNKCELPKDQFNRPPQCSRSQNLPTELETESNYTYPNPTTKRISRVRKDILTNASSVPTNHTENNQRCNTNTTNLPLKRTADNLAISNKCDVIKKKARISQKCITKEQADIGTRETASNKNESEGYQQNETSNTQEGTPSQDRRNMHIDYSDINMFDTQNVTKSIDTSEKTNNPVNKNDSEVYKQDETSNTQDGTPSRHRRNMQIDYSDVNMFDTQNICKSMVTSEIPKNPVSNNQNDSEVYKQNETSTTKEGTSSQDSINSDPVILAKSPNPRQRFADYSDINMFDNQNVSKSIDTSEISNNPVSKNDSEVYKQNETSNTQEGTSSQDDIKTDSVILAKSSNDMNTHCEDYENSEIPWKQSILGRMIYKYASKPEIQIIPKGNDEVATKIKNGIEICVKNMPEQKDYLTSVNQLVNELRPYDKQVIVFGLMSYLKDPARLSEFVIANDVKKGYNKGPSASKTEIALIDVLQTIQKHGIDIWDPVLDMSEFILFRLEPGASPCFAVLEGVGHFFANVCKYRNDPSRLWLFMLNAMYCFSFKAIPLIKQCLDVAPEIIPHSRTYMETAREPLIRCFVFLLTYYNCQDRYKRIDEIRRRLKYHYKYNLQDENETTLLFFLKQAIIQLADAKTDKLILELVFLIVAKRQGTKWTHRNIILKILLPMLDNDEVSCTAKRFCITTMGCILKPYNNEMLVHTEIVVNTLTDLFELPSQRDIIKDDIIRSFMSMDIYTLWERMNKCLLDWNPPKLSQELENAMKVYVNRKHSKVWKGQLMKYNEKTLC